MQKSTNQVKDLNFNKQNKSKFAKEKVKSLKEIKNISNNN